MTMVDAALKPQVDMICNAHAQLSLSRRLCASGSTSASASPSTFETLFGILGLTLDEPPSSPLGPGEAVVAAYVGVVATTLGETSAYSDEDDGPSQQCIRHRYFALAAASECLCDPDTRRLYIVLLLKHGEGRVLHQVLARLCGTA